jgi:hypothetical protein
MVKGEEGREKGRTVSPNNGARVLPFPFHPYLFTVAKLRKI